jgi:hypothetical protein
MKRAKNKGKIRRREGRKEKGFLLLIGGLISWNCKHDLGYALCM